MCCCHCIAASLGRSSAIRQRGTGQGGTVIAEINKEARDSSYKELTSSIDICDLGVASLIDTACDGHLRKRVDLYMLRIGVSRATILNTVIALAINVPVSFPFSSPASFQIGAEPLHPAPHG